MAKTTFKKSDAEWIFQLEHAASVLDRLAAFDALNARNTPSQAVTTALASFVIAEPVADARARAAGELSPGPRSAQYASALRSALHDPSAHVRRAAADALADFPANATATKALQDIAAHDQSYRTIAAAVQTLADWHAPGVDRLLAQALAQPSNNAEISSAALTGYATVQGKAAIPLERRYARYGAPLDSRGAAILALGRIGKGEPKVTAFLGGLLGDPDLVTNFTILRALTSIGDPAALKPIRDLAGSTEDERLRDRALAAADAITKAANPHGGASQH